MERDSARLLNRPGTYVLILHLPVARVIRVGRLGRLELSAGFYAYVGSALGPGGLKARLDHHLGKPVRPHWHIDYLRRVARLVQIWASAQAVRREHDWAQLLCRWSGALPAARGFGSSDCPCPTHLFRWVQAPSIAVFQRLVRARFPADAPVCAWRPTGGAALSGPAYPVKFGGITRSHCPWICCSSSSSPPSSSPWPTAWWAAS